MISPAPLTVSSVFRFLNSGFMRMPRPKKIGTSIADKIIIEFPIFLSSFLHKVVQTILNQLNNWFRSKSKDHIQNNKQNKRIPRI